MSEFIVLNVPNIKKSLSFLEYKSMFLYKKLSAFCLSSLYIKLHFNMRHPVVLTFGYPSPEFPVLVNVVCEWPQVFSLHDLLAQHYMSIFYVFQTFIIVFLLHDFQDYFYYFHDLNTFYCIMLHIYFITCIRCLKIYACGNNLKFVKYHSKRNYFYFFEFSNQKLQRI